MELAPKPIGKIEPETVEARPQDPTLAISAGVEDPLLECLEFLTKHHGHPRSAESLKAGLPSDGPMMTAGLFVRAAERAGFNARVTKRRIKSISKHVLPAVLTLSDRRACVLVALTDGKTAQVFVPETGGSMETVPIAELDEDYTGYAIFVRPKVHLDLENRADEAAKPTSWFWGAIASNWWAYVQVGLAAIFINLFALVSPFFVMMVYDRVVPNAAMETLWVLASGVCIIILFDFVLKTLRSYFIDSAGKRTDVTVACRIFDQVLDLSMKARPGSAGAFANTLREFETLREFFTSATLAALIDLPFVFLFIGVLWVIAGDLALVLLAAVPIVLLYGIFVQFPLNKAVRENFREAELKHGVLVEAINGLETIKTIGAEAKMRGLWEGVVGLTARSSQKSRAWSQSGVNVTGAIQQLTSIAVVVAGVHLITDGTITIGALIACVMLGGRALAPLAQVAQLLTRFHQSMSSLKALNRIMSSPVERPADKTFLHRPVIEGGITFDNVKFSYEGREEAALDGLSFNLKAGEKVGIIGRVGSGKSTIAKLVLGLYEPEEGSLLIDGTDIRQIDPADLRRNIGYVAQDPFLFRGSVKDNIAAGFPQADDQAIIEAARLSGIHEFISQNAMGYDLPVGERGDGLSGGQRQAVTIARALLRDPRLLVLDEPTASMDSRSEQALKANLKEFMEDRTLLLVTHRASLLSMVDRVLIMDKGAVVADGPRAEILEALAAGKVSSGQAPAPVGDLKSGGEPE